MALLDEFLILFTTQVRGNGIQQVNKQIAGTTRGLLSANNMLKVFFGYDLYRFVRQLVPDLVATSQQLGAMESRFNAVSTSARAGAQELGWVGDQSKRLGLNFLKVADDYSIFYATVRKNMGQGTTRKVFQDWAEAFRVLHIDPERQSRVLYALREMSSKGKIYMQDLALQLGSAVPDAMNLAATSMGYVGPNAVNRFRDAIRKGEVDVKKFIPLFSEMVNKTYVNSDKLAKAMNLPDAQIQLMTTHWQFLQKGIYEAGFGKDLVNGLKLLNKGLGFLEKHAGSLYKILKGIVIFGGVLLGGATIIKLVQVGKLIADIVKGMIALRAVTLSMLAFGGSATTGASLILLLTQPELWIGVLVVALLAGLMMVLNKFFPNVTKRLWATLIDIQIFFDTLIRKIDSDFRNSLLGKYIASQTKKDKSEFRQTLDRQNSLHPNWKFPSFVLAVDEFAHKKALSLTPQGRAMNSMSAVYHKYFQPQIKIEVTAHGSDVESIAKATVEGFKRGAKQFWNDMNVHTGNSKINGRPTRNGYESMFPTSSSIF